ncbi:MAG: hypothetical protein HOV70_33050 [Streptomyces sp.]|nr:hypothetical protein [Streptomyces sp.]
MAHQDRPSNDPGNHASAWSAFRNEMTNARNGIRRDIIEWWMSSHPEDPQPGTSREVFTLWLHELVEEIFELPEKRIENLRAGAEKYAQKVSTLSEIEQENVTVVEDAIRSAYWSEHSRASWSMALEDFIEERPALRSSLSTVAFLVALWVPMLLLVHEEDFKEFPGQGYIAIAVLSFILFFTHGRILAILGRVGSGFVNMWRLLAVGVSFYLIVQDDWRRKTVEWVSNRKSVIPGSFSVVAEHADLCVLYALKAFGVVALIGAVLSAFDAARYKVGPKEPEDVVASARLLLDLLELAITSQEALQQPSAAGDGLRTYLTGPTRFKILRLLEKIAQMAEGRWVRSLKVDDEIPDKAIYDVGVGIAAAARKWKVVAATGGESLVEMNGAFVTALVDAAKGNWALLAAEASEKELLRRKLFRFVRHILALAVMVGAVCVVLFDPFSWFGAPLNAAVSSFILMLAAIVAVSIDPGIVERIGNASKVSGAFGTKK